MWRRWGGEWTPMGLRILLRICGSEAFVRQSDSPFPSVELGYRDDARRGAAGHEGEHDEKELESYAHKRILATAGSQEYIRGSQRSCETYSPPLQHPQHPRQLLQHLRRWHQIALTGLFIPFDQRFECSKESRAPLSIRIPDTGSAWPASRSRSSHNARAFAASGSGASGGYCGLARSRQGR
jgi:hypothetical protein